MSRSYRVLFFAETVTLAHLARPLALARGLDPDRYRITIACDGRYQRFLAAGSWETAPLTSISTDRFLRALARGSPVYDIGTLSAYVEEDLKHVATIKPDLIVGDFRLSLSVSARVAGIPYITLTNAYWSPYAAKREFPLPVLPVTRALPLLLVDRIFRLVQPLVLAAHCAPLNRLRRHYGLPSLGKDVRRIYSDADYTLYADIPELFPTADLPDTHHYLGPLLWSPPVAKPGWWDRPPADSPLIYVTLGSSGQSSLLPTVLEALQRLPVTVMAATVKAPPPAYGPPKVWAADYLPGTEAAARAALVICNGGSPTTQQALAAGVPVLGIASNMDQFLNMGAVARAGAGILQRADRVNRKKIRSATEDLLGDVGFRRTAKELSAIFARYDAPKRFAQLVSQIVGGKGDGVGLG